MVGPLDRKRLWAEIHRYFRGAEFNTFLELEDSAVNLNRMARRANGLLQEVPMASRRAFVRFHHQLEAAVARAFTENHIRSSWDAVLGGLPMNQQTIFESNPDYRDAHQFTEEKKIEIALLIPQLISAATPTGYASDQQIFEALGHLIGPPRRGGVDVAPEDDTASAASSAAPSAPPAYHAANCRSRLATSLARPLLCDCATQHIAAAIGHPSAIRQVKPLNQLAKSRWRAILLTSETIRENSHIQGERERVIDLEVQRKAEAKLASVVQREAIRRATAEKKIERDAAKARKELENTQRAAAGPARRVNKPNPVQEECSNNQCCTTYEAPDEGVSDWRGCDYCNRWFCGRDECLTQLEVHTPVCFEKSKRMRLQQSSASGK